MNMFIPNICLEIFAEARRAAQSVLQIEKTNSLSVSDSWLLEKCRVGQVNVYKRDRSDPSSKLVKDKIVKGEKKHVLDDKQDNDDYVPKAKKKKV